MLKLPVRRKAEAHEAVLPAGLVFYEQGRLFLNAKDLTNPLPPAVCSLFYHVKIKNTC